MKVVFIVPMFNAAPHLKELIDSLQEQTNPNWEAVLIDDLSTDDTIFMANHCSGNDERIKVIANKEKKWALKNVVDNSRNVNLKDIVAILDGDDSICNPDTVKILIDRYESGNLDAAWTGHRWDINDMNISKSMPTEVDPYQWPWSSSHLKTFKSSLMKSISHDNFKNYKGEWFKRGYDQALMLPILHLSDRFEYIEEICYQYNIDSASIPSEKREWSEMEQISTINFVRARGFLTQE